jgi:hypothetical protein
VQIMHRMTSSLHEVLPHDDGRTSWNSVMEAVISV